VKRSRFGSSASGGWVQPVPNTDPVSLRPLLVGAHGLPKRLRTHAGLDGFLLAVASLCAHHVAMHDEGPAVTPAARRDALLSLETAAHRMQNSLAPLRAGATTPDLFEAIEPAYWYLAQRARDPRTEGRPAVPSIPSSLPSTLSDLLSMVDDGLAALRATCSHVANQITPSASIEKARERDLARAVAAAHLEAFGELPPAGGWFGRHFMPELGHRIGWDIGHKVVKQAVDSLQAEAAPSPG